MQTVRTKLEQNGIPLRAAHVSSLGIECGSECWGLWNDAGDLFKHADLRDDKQYLDNQAPHLIVSPLHPQFWSHSFELVALLERKQARDLHDPASSDSIVGLTDALNRCGVNILFMETGQTGYSVVAVTATCELPVLRAAASELVAKADAASVELAEARWKHGQQQLSHRQIKEAERKAATIRGSALADLSTMLIPQLARVEAQLSLLDNVRFHFNPPSRLVRDTSAVTFDDGNPLFCGTGEDASVAGVISRPWFFSSKVVEVGENPYFMCPPEFIDNAGLNSMIRRGERDILSANQNKKASTDAPKISRLGIDLLSGERRTELFERTRSVLSARPIREPWKTIIASRVSNSASEGLSGAAQRAIQTLNGEELQRAMIAKVFERQMYYPARTRAHSALAHARFHTLSVRTGGTFNVEPVRLMYQQPVVQEEDESRTSANRRSVRDHLVEQQDEEIKTLKKQLAKFKEERNGAAYFLSYDESQENKNESSQQKIHEVLKQYTNEHPANPESSNRKEAYTHRVLATINHEERHVRLRFLRKHVVDNALRELLVGYNIPVATGAEAPRTKGLLATVTYEFCDPNSAFWKRETQTWRGREVPFGLRVEYVKNHLSHIVGDMERGTIKIGVKAACPQSLWMLRYLEKHERSLGDSVWRAIGLNSHSPSDSNGRITISLRPMESDAELGLSF